MHSWYRNWSQAGSRWYVKIIAWPGKYLKERCDGLLLLLPGQKRHNTFWRVLDIFQCTSIKWKSQLTVRSDKLCFRRRYTSSNTFRMTLGHYCGGPRSSSPISHCKSNWAQKYETVLLRTERSLTLATIHALSIHVSIFSVVILHRGIRDLIAGKGLQGPCQLHRKNIVCRWFTSEFHSESTTCCQYKNFDRKPTPVIPRAKFMCIGSV